MLNFKSLLTAATLSVIGTTAFAATTPGALDTSWGGTGVISGSFPGTDPSAGAFSKVESISTGANNKVYVAGYLQTTENLEFYGLRANKYAGIIQAYTAAGVLDTSFGNNGTVSLNESTNIYLVEYVKPLATGKLLVITQRKNLDGLEAIVNSSQLESDVVFIRLNADGSIDTSFGSNGKVTYKRSNKLDSLGKVVESSDGKLLLSLSEYCFNGCTTLTYFSKFDYNGVLDTSYGVNGYLDLGQENFISTSQLDIKVLKDGSEIIGAEIVGIPTHPLTPPYVPYFFQHILSDGQHDSSFGANGSLNVTEDEINRMVTSYFPLSTQGLSLLVKTAVMSFTEAPSPELKKYLSSGSLDESFNNNINSTIEKLGFDYSELSPTKEFNDGKILFQRLHNAYGTGACELSSFRTLSDATLDTKYAPIAATHVSIPKPDSGSCQLNSIIDGSKGKQLQLVQVNGNSGPESFTIVRYTGGALNTGLLIGLGLLATRRKRK